MRKLLLLATSASLWVSLQATAATFNFSATDGLYGDSSAFTDNGGSPNSFTFSEEGINVTVTAFASSNRFGSTTATVTRDYFDLIPFFGLGVNWGFDTDGLDDTIGIDFLLFTFDQLVNIDSYRIFKAIDAGNDTMWAAGIDLGISDIAIPLANSSFNELTSVSASGVNSILVAAYSTDAIGDDMAIKYMTVSKTNSVPDSSATLSLLGASFLAILGFRRFSKKA